MTTIKVKGMRCGHCVASVTKALEALDGATNVRVDLATGAASFDEVRPVEKAQVRAAIEAIGFEVD